MAKLTKGALLVKFKLDSDADRRILRSTFAALSKIHHPDTGGDEKVFRCIKKAYDELYAMLPECNRCKDRGLYMDRGLQKTCDCKIRRHNNE